MNALEVVWINDDLITPPGPKMVVCVEPNLGFYFRINSNDNYEPCVTVRREPNHLFLKWDSFIQCTILDLDDYLINRALQESGVVGTIATELCDPLIAAVGAANCSKLDRNAIREVLENVK